MLPGPPRNQIPINLDDSDDSDDSLLLRIPSRPLTELVIPPGPGRRKGPSPSNISGSTIPRRPLTDSGSPPFRPLTELVIPPGPRSKVQTPSNIPGSKTPGSPLTDLGSPPEVPVPFRPLTELVIPPGPRSKGLTPSNISGPKIPGRPQHKDMDIDEQLTRRISVGNIYEF